MQNSKRKLSDFIVIFQKRGFLKNIEICKRIKINIPLKNEAHIYNLIWENTYEIY